METINVYTFHSNGNDVVCRRMNAERVSDNILYISKEEKYGTWSETYYYLIVNYNGIAVMLNRTKRLDNITNITFNEIVEVFENKAESKSYFNKVELVLCRAISDELYAKALSSRIYVLKQREEEERKEDEKRKKEEQEEKNPEGTRESSKIERTGREEKTR